MSKYTLNVKETGNKAAKYHYTITDETGTVISERKSNRVYVAATANGSFYFGRLDLVGKGDHGKQVRWCIENNKTPEPIAYKETAPVS